MGLKFWRELGGKILCHGRSLVLLPWTNQLPASPFHHSTIIDFIVL